MGTYNKILLILIALAYLASPIDLIPDLFVPFFGLIDDTFLIGLIIYYLRFNRLPDFLNWGSGGSSSNTRNNPHGADNSTHGSTGNWTGDRANNDQPKGRNQQKSFSSTKKPHEILGIKENATKEEIQAAFRAAAKQYHPDRVAGLGKELQDLANEKFIEIQNAYTLMMDQLK